MSPVTHTQSSTLRLVECPRDAMQGWEHLIPTAQKIKYLNALLQVGFHTLDFGSFVSPKAIPQMADTKEVLAGLNIGESNTKLLAIVANQRGAEAAVAYDEIRYLGFPFSISPTFQLRNANSTIEESVARVDAIQDLCVQRNKELVLYLSMGFGNPYGDPYSEEVLLYWTEEMVKKGIGIISLADTVGLASAEQVGKALKTIIPAYPKTTIGVHLHASTGNWRQKIDAAIDAGCMRFDGALKGIGGCPMAQDELVGNMDTVLLIAAFRERGLLAPLNENALQECLQIADEIFI